MLSPRSVTTSTASSTRPTLNADAAPTAYTAFERTLARRCPGVVTSLREGGDELLTFFRFPKAQRKTLRTTNTIERLHEEFRRRVKTQGSLPTEDAALVLLFSLVASGQIKLRKIDGFSDTRRVLGLVTSWTTHVLFYAQVSWPVKTR
jgi:transposase-like protein